MVRYFEEEVTVRQTGEPIALFPPLIVSEGDIDVNRRYDLEEPAQNSMNGCKKRIAAPCRMGMWKTIATFVRWWEKKVIFDSYGKQRPPNLEEKTLLYYVMELHLLPWMRDAFMTRQNRPERK